MEAINSIAYFIWGKFMVNLVYNEIWEHYAIDQVGFWFCFGVAIVFLTIVGILSWKSSIRGSRRNERTTF